MVELNVSIEIKGKQVGVGSIYGTSYKDACFQDMGTLFLSKLANSL